jgi:cation diffusion facilitator family transporter
MSTHEHSIDPFRHDHVYLGEHHERNERKTWAVIALCAAMMVGEILGGWLFGSMALIADGMHMSTHAAALLIAAWAYTYARRHALDRRFAFGTGKLGELAGYSSALILAMIAILIGFESVSRLLSPVHISFDQALPIAGLGLCVNLLSAWLLRDDHDHAHGHEHHDHDHHHDHAHDHADHAHDDDRGHKNDLNMRAAYVHVLADAAVSVLAIIGLLAGRELGWAWMDPVMGIIGACVIANWSWGLIRAAGSVLLDMSSNDTLADSIKTRLEIGADRVADFHLWRLGPGHNAVIATLVTDKPEPASAYKARLADVRTLSHITIEVEACTDGHTD